LHVTSVLIGNTLECLFCGNALSCEWQPTLEAFLLVTSSIAIETRHNVLLVDDDPVSLELMALLLSHDGHQVLRASSARAALALLRKDDAADPDVLLVDLQMPGMSGSQLAAKVRALPNSGKRPLLLAMSATEAATEAEAQQLLAFDAFLLKPLALEDLRRALNRQTHLHRSGIRVVHSRPQPSAAAVVDMAVVNKLLTMMTAEAFEKVVAACIADTRSCIAALQAQAGLSNVTLVRETAHRIKGAALMVGATHMARLAGGLEAGGDEEAATRTVLNDLLSACIELEGKLLAGKSK